MGDKKEALVEKLRGAGESRKAVLNKGKEVGSQLVREQTDPELRKKRILDVYEA